MAKKKSSPSLAKQAEASPILFILKVFGALGVAGLRLAWSQTKKLFK